MPVSILSVVDLPAPFGPMNATRSPGAMPKLTPSTATKGASLRRAKCLVRF